MENQSLAVHRTIVAVDVEGFGNRYRTNRNQVAVRDGLYGALRQAFGHAGIPWLERDHEDRGDGVFILVGAEVPKSLFVESLPTALVDALREHNDTHPGSERIRLRMALHAGEVNYDAHGATAAAINLTFRLLECLSVKEALAASPGVLAVIASSWFFDEVIRHNTVNAADYYPIPVVAKETTTTGWICLPDHADRARLDRAAAAAAAAAAVTAARPPATHGARRICEALSRAYISALAEPITPAGDMPAGLEIPTLGAGYIDHRIRVAEVTSSSDPGRESWWADVPVNDNACHFLLTGLTSPEALKAPVILLGHPGSGKSVLTRILAARFSTAGFLPVRVELRQAAVQEDLQDQIEFAIRSATGEVTAWTQVAEQSGCILPVVIFDGFDELLQATGIAQHDFLIRVQQFQEREARLGRPLAVIVTSRTAVTYIARIPHGSTVIRLEPFDEEQITAWLEIWARTNHVSLAKRGMHPLPTGVALSYGELAEQPLLLLMLALYDADANILQHRSAALSRTELYSRLLKDFAIREISKQSPAWPEAELERAVEAELLRLSVVAFAMFNRRTQWIPEADLEADFSALLTEAGRHELDPAPPHDQLTMAQLTVGRFFFVHESRATHDHRQLRTYEFLHATFGEFLAARLVVRVLTEMLAAEPSSGRGTGSGLLHALLSFSALTSRSPVVVFLGDLLEDLNAQQRAAIAEMLLRLHSRALFHNDESAYSRYEPLALTVTTRHAAWSANLVVLAVLAAGEITGAQLFPDEPDLPRAWRRETLIWRSQLAGRGWEEMHEVIALDREWKGEQREIRLSRNDGTFMPEPPDMFWSFYVPRDREMRKEIYSSPTHNSLMTQRKINFTCNNSEDILAHGLGPLVSSFPTTANILVVLDDERVISAAHALVSALCAPYLEGQLTDSAYLDLTQVACKLMRTPNAAPDVLYLKMAFGVLISALEQRIVPPASLGPMAEFISKANANDTELTGLLSRLDALLPER
jgi:hypothetical protein